MKKNSGGETQTIQSDPITGDYYVIIPEWIVNEFSWYEDTEIKMTIDGNELILSESLND